MSHERPSQEEIIKGLVEGVTDFDQKKVEDLAHQVIANNFDAYEAIRHGLSFGLEAVGKRFEKREVFVPELLMAAKAAMRGIEILKPHISMVRSSGKGVFLIGTVKGDIHSIGKDIVALIMEASGFEVHNLGINVEHRSFIEEAEKHKAHIVGLSALMSTTMNHMKTVIETFKKEGVREKYLILVGGAPVSQKWAEMIGADGFAPDAVKTVEVARNLLQEKQASKNS